MRPQRLVVPHATRQMPNPAGVEHSDSSFDDMAVGDGTESRAVAEEEAGGEEGEEGGEEEGEDVVDNVVDKPAWAVGRNEVKQELEKRLQADQGEAEAEMAWQVG